VHGHGRNVWESVPSIKFIKKITPRAPTKHLRSPYEIKHAFGNVGNLTAKWGWLGDLRFTISRFCVLFSSFFCSFFFLFLPV